MPWIYVKSHDEAEGLLKKEYDSAMKRAGRIWNIVSIMSQNPRAMKASMAFYGTLMFGPSPLSRSQREMLATVVSVANHCLYWIRAHAHDLRAEVENDWNLADSQIANETVHYIASDWRKANLSKADQALCTYADKLTNHPKQMKEDDVQALKKAGFDDRAVHDATQVISSFNYINRIADALDVQPESFVHEWEKSIPES